ncbi:hypothetical protein C0585_04495 [Candidatus Woesearchaeota archaeon]|nr:MAG: hypothetical protein C0585_04495 [Candidatus Woesearchaeota archaeon]
MRKEIFVLIIFLLMFQVVYADEIEDTLTNYYESFKTENLDLYYDTQTLNLFTEEQRISEKELINLIFEKTDLIDYKINNLEYTIDGNAAVLNYELYAKVTEGDESLEYTENFVAILVKEDKWMVFKIVPQATFEVLVNDAGINGDFSDNNDLIFDGNEIKDSCVANLSLIEYVDGVNMYDYASQKVIDMVAGDKNIEFKIGEESIYLAVSSGVIKLLDSEPETIHFIAETDECIFEEIANQELDPMVAYNNDKITLKGNTIGSKTKTFFGKIGLTIFNFFNKKNNVIEVEGEDGTLGGPIKYSFIGETSRGPGELYLGSGGSYASYTFESGAKQSMYLYVKVSDDSKHANGARSVVIDINGEEYDYNHVSATYNPWGWEYVAKIKVQKGTNTLVITKPKQTSAAFVMDKLVLKGKEEMPK